MSQTVIQRPDQQSPSPWVYAAQNVDLHVLKGFIDVLQGWYRLSDSDTENIRRCVIPIHISYLALDDIKFGRSSRRGRPAAHMVFGIPHTTRDCKLIILGAIRQLTKMKNVRCMRILLDEIIRRTAPIIDQDTFLSRSKEDHIEALDENSGAIIRLTHNLISAASPLQTNQKPSIDNLINLFARLYALRDDYSDLVSQGGTPAQGKKAKIQAFYIALDEGKYSLLLVHALNILPDDKALILRTMLVQRQIMGRFENEDKPLVLEILRGCRSFEYVIGLIRILGGNVLCALDQLALDCNSGGWVPEEENVKERVEGGVNGDCVNRVNEAGKVDKGVVQEGVKIDVSGFRLLVDKLGV